MKLLRRLLIALIVLVVLGYAGVVAYMYVNQRALQYSAQGPVFSLADTLLTGAEDVAIDSDASVVNGWYQPPREGMPVILYYKGNSKSFSEEHERYEQFAAAGVRREAGDELVEARPQRRRGVLAGELQGRRQDEHGLVEGGPLAREVQVGPADVREGPALVEG